MARFSEAYTEHSLLHQHCTHEHEATAQGLREHYRVRLHTDRRQSMRLSWIRDASKSNEKTDLHRGLGEATGYITLSYFLLYFY